MDDLEISFEDQPQQAEEQPKLSLEEVIKFVMSSPEAQQALLGIAMAQAQSQAAATPATPPVDPDEARLQELEAKLRENPQDWEAFMELVATRARLEARKASEPVRLQAQAEILLQDVAKYLQTRDPNFTQYGEEVLRELRQLILHDPGLARDVATLRTTAEVIADRHFAQWVRKGVKKQPLTGPGVTKAAQPQGGLPAELAPLYEEAKKIYPELTPETFQKFYSTEDTFVWREG